MIFYGFTKDTTSLGTLSKNISMVRIMCTEIYLHVLSKSSMGMKFPGKV